MGVTLERVQNKFACIIGELCNDPQILSQFAIWVDMRIAEYKAKGFISLDCCGDSPTPSWLCGYRPPVESRERTRDNPVKHEGGARSTHGPDVWEQQRSPDFSRRLSQDFMEIKDETEDVYPVNIISTSVSRKRSGGDFSEHFSLHNSIPSKIQHVHGRASPTVRLSSNASTSEPVHESLMSIIGTGDTSLIQSGNTNIIHQVDSPDVSCVLDASQSDNTETAAEVPSTSRGDNSIHDSQPTGYGGGVFLPRSGSGNSDRTGVFYPQRLSYDRIRARIKCQNKTNQIVKNLTNAVGNLERWLWKTSGESRNLEEIPPTELNNYLKNYFTVVQKHSGGDYTPISLANLRSLIERYLKECSYGYSICHSPEFLTSQTAFSQRRKALTELHHAMTLSQNAITVFQNAMTATQSTLADSQSSVSSSVIKLELKDANC